MHGWGANRHIFKAFAQQLHQNSCTVTAWDLPGHGENYDDGFSFDIIATADAFAQRIDTPQHFFAWSLGGLIALYIAARHPEKVKSLTLCASFAKLCAAPDYPEGLQQLALTRMIALFQQDYPKYMRQFLELQLMHTPDRHAMIAAVLPDIIKNGHPTALQSALNALEVADARAILPLIHTPTLLIYGQKDTITPLRMGEYLLHHLPHAKLHIVERAAHAPFLSHETETLKYFLDFIQNQA